MNKLLHERLRETANTCRFVRAKGFQCYLSEDLACELADEIEKYYIPRPRFENGEPVQFGDEVKDGTIHEIAFWDDGTIILLDETPETIYEASAGCFIKRTEPKVLDADGVEIKVDDMVWVKNSPFEPLLVSGFKDGRVLMSYHNETSLGYKPTSLTHCEPDSLEKLRNDMREFVDTEYKIPGGTKTNEWLDRLTAIMERDA